MANRKNSKTQVTEKNFSRPKDFICANTWKVSQFNEKREISEGIWRQYLDIKYIFDDFKTDFRLNEARILKEHQQLFNRTRKLESSKEFKESTAKIQDNLELAMATMSTIVEEVELCLSEVENEIF